MISEVSITPAVILEALNELISASPIAPEAIIPEHIDAVLLLVTAEEELSHRRGHVHPAPFLLVLLWVEEAELYLRVVATYIGEMAHHRRVVEEGGRARLDGQCRHDDDELVQSAAFVQLIHRARIHIGLACTRLHLHVEDVVEG